ncbi:zinc finger protein 420-like [Culex pipiens pallens]|uniref:zinc finger protein 420-like n=1 Tax=Culex pipiens pallens TaxID=42434 RepID=UPI0019541D29|nr:zinc finger protein 420-like [Culex pipiens pallens]
MGFKTKRQLSALRRQKAMALTRGKTLPTSLPVPVNEPTDQIPDPTEKPIKGKKSLTRKVAPNLEKKCPLCGLHNPLEQYDQYFVCRPCQNMFVVFTGSTKVTEALLKPADSQGDEHVALPEVPQEIDMEEEAVHEYGPVESPKDESNGNIVEKLEIVTHSCKNCARVFDTKPAMLHHFNLCKNQPVAERKWHTCSICQANFSRPLQLRDHLNKHKGIKPYKCRKANCDAHFYGARARITHEHNCGSVPLECQVCGKVFKTKSRLTRHQTVHSEERNFPCSVCTKRFKSSYAASVHMRIHTQEKPFCCPVCAQGFAYKCLVKPHLEKCHASKAD